MSNQVPAVFAGQRIVGMLVIALGSALPCSALVHFGSWRLRAQLDAGHRLVTDGPFGAMRHPIYLAFDLLALGTAIWVEHPITWAALVLMIVSGDLRGRVEEKRLTRALGSAYAG